MESDIYKALEYTYTLTMSVIKYEGKTMAMGTRHTAIESIASLLEARYKGGGKSIQTFEEYVETEEGEEWYKDAFAIRAEYAKVYNASLIRADLQGVYELVMEEREN